MPTPAEEQARSISRLRQSFQAEKQRLAARGRITALYYGHRLAGEWFAPARWNDLAPTLPPIVRQLLEPLQRLITAVEQELAALTRRVEAAAPADLPLGMGRLTAQVLEREVCDWQRFANRREVASYTGMCPREDTLAQRRFQGPINKYGNPRVRTFKLSRDPAFVEQLTDVAGLYLNPPDKALVLCVDGENQIQALDRSVMLERCASRVAVWVPSRNVKIVQHFRLLSQLRGGL